MSFFHKMVLFFIFLSSYVHADVKKLPFVEVQKIKAMYYENNVLMHSVVVDELKRLSEEYSDVSKMIFKKYKENDALKVYSESNDNELFLYKLIIDQLSEIASGEKDEEQTIYALFLVEYLKRDLDLQKKRIKHNSMSVIDLFELSKKNNFEATNLTKNDETLMNPIDVLEAKNEGALYNYNPLKCLHTWRNNNVENYIVNENYFYNSKIYDGVKVEFPREKIYFKNFHKENNRFKIVAGLDRVSKKNQYYISFGDKAQKEYLATMLLSILGYHTKIFKTYRKIDLYVEGQSLNDFKNNWNKYFKNLSFDDFYINHSRVSETELVIELKQSVLEFKTENIEFLSTTSLENSVLRSNREMRALELFRYWIGDLSKIEANKKLYYRKDLKTEKITDSIFVIAEGFQNAFLPSDNDFNISQNLTDIITYSDYKWMAQRISRIKLGTLMELISLSSNSLEENNRILNLLMAKRNFLIEYFQLDAKVIHFKDYYNGIEKSMINKSNQYDKYFTYQGRYFSSSKFRKAILKMSKYFDSIVVGPGTLGIDTSIISDIEFSPSKIVTPNPRSTSNNDRFIVQTKVKVKYSLGAGIVLRGKISYIREYNLTFPIGSYDQKDMYDAAFHRIFTPTIFSPMELPSKFVLIQSDMFEGEGEFILGDAASAISLGSAYKKGHLSRTVISQNDSNVIVQADIGHYDSIISRLYAQLFILRVPVFEGFRSSMLMNRSSFYVDLNFDNFKSYSDLLTKGNILDFSKYAYKSSSILADSSVSQYNFDLFGLYENKEKVRVDILDYANKFTKEKYIQIDQESTSLTNILNYDEENTNVLRLFGHLQDNSVKNPNIELKILIDNNSIDSTDVKKDYVKFANRIAVDHSFIKLPKSMNKYKHFYFYSSLLYSTKAINKLLQSKDSDYFKLMEKYSNCEVKSDCDARFWSKRRSKKYISRDVKKLKRQLHAFLNRLNKAKKSSQNLDKYKFLLKAFQELFWKEGKSYSFHLLQKINLYIQSDNYAIESFITSPEASLTRHALYKSSHYNTRNEFLRREYKFFELDFDRPLEVWEIYFSNLRQLQLVN